MYALFFSVLLSEYDGFGMAYIKKVHISFWRSALLVLPIIFTDKERTDYELRIELSIDKEKDMFRIDFRNNGIPFPQGLTKELYGRRGKSAGKTKNKGTGGYVVQSICKHVGGDFEIYSNLESNFPVTVRLYLPIHKDDEQI